jgi:hypothetical protein
LKHKSYKILSKFFNSSMLRSPLFNRTNSLRSCRGYCLTAHVIVARNLVGGNKLVLLVDLILFVECQYLLCNGYSICMNISLLLS